MKKIMTSKPPAEAKISLLGEKSRDSIGF